MKKPSIWYWVICVLLLLWSSFGALDYVMTRTQNEAYMSQYPQELLDYWSNMPLLLDFTWPLAVWSGLLGWVFMLLRRSWAVPVLIFSFVCMIVNFGYMAINGGLALQAEMMGTSTYAFTGMIILLGVFGIWYSRRAKADGLLK